jgi:tetratricopeptide (TPR) repeat protein
MPPINRKTNLSSYPFHRVLAEIFLHKLTGTLILENNLFEKTIIFDQGIPVYAQSSLVEESLGAFLVKRKELDEATVHQAFNDSITSGRPLGEVLVAQGMLEPSKLFTALRRNFGLCIINAFRMDNGQFNVSQDEPDVEGKLLLKVQPASLVLRGILGYASLASVQSDFQDALDQEFCLRKEAFQEMSGLNLNAVDTRMVKQLEQPQTLMSLTQGAQVSDEMALRFMYAFALLGLIGKASAVALEERESQPPAPPQETGLEPEKLVVSTPNPNELMPLPEPLARVIDQAYLVVKGQSYFQILGVKQSATPEEIKKAYLSQSARMSPAKLAKYQLGERAERLEEIFLILAKAYTFLSDSQLRASYQQRLDQAESASQANRQTTKATTNSFFAIKTDLLNTETHIENGLKMLHKNNPQEALKHFSFAVDIDPHNVKALVYLGQALYLDDPANNYAKAIGCLQKALAIEPRSELSYFYLGRIQEMAKERSLALSSYRECLNIEPDHKDAQAAVRRLSHLSKKK